MTYELIKVLPLAAHVDPNWGDILQQTNFQAKDSKLLILLHCGVDRQIEA